MNIGKFYVKLLHQPPVVIRSAQLHWFGL